MSDADSTYSTACLQVSNDQGSLMLAKIIEIQNRGNYTLMSCLRNNDLITTNWSRFLDATASEAHEPWHHRNEDLRPSAMPTTRHLKEICLGFWQARFTTNFKANIASTIHLLKKLRLVWNLSFGNVVHQWKKTVQQLCEWPIITSHRNAIVKYTSTAGKVVRNSALIITIGKEITQTPVDEKDQTIGSCIRGPQRQ